jgi:plasmid maintenance system killer protein
MWMGAGSSSPRSPQADFDSIRINDQWRVIFKWIDGEPHEVRIVDYH